MFYSAFGNHNLKSSLSLVESEHINDVNEHKIKMNIYTDAETIKRLNQHSKQPPRPKPAKVPDQLKNLKVIYTTPIKFVNYALDYNEEYMLPPDFLELLVKKVFTEEKYKYLLHDIKQTADK